MASVKAFFLFLLLACVAGLELGGKALLEKKGNRSPYQLFFQSVALQPRPPLFVFPYLDPLLGWGRNPGFQEYVSDGAGASASKNRKAKRIIALGGSTTDPAMEGRNWVYYLAQECTKNKLLCQALNGGIGGYTSTQEFLKLVRDAAPLKPDIVISLNGINDEALPYLGGNSFVSSQKLAIEKIHREKEVDAKSPLGNPPDLEGLFPHARFLWHFLRYQISKEEETPFELGTLDNFSNAKRWETNVRMMHAVSQELGFSYLVFLQPHLALDPLAVEGKIREDGIVYLDKPEKVKNFYDSARASCQKMSFCVDLSQTFLGQPEQFLDVWHLRSPGHETEAKQIFKTLRAKGLL